MLSYFNAIIEKEDDAYVALCPELDIVSQGETVEASKDNLREATVQPEDIDFVIQLVYICSIKYCFVRGGEHVHGSYSGSHR